VPASKYRFHPAAEAELKESSDWYEDRREGLGLDFLAAVRHKIFDILENPQRWRAFNGTRRVLVGRFPYALVYREITPDEVEIVAVTHFKSRPKYWSRR
jgi:plasmid stabilization system protein ParE